MVLLWWQEIEWGLPLWILQSGVNMQIALTYCSRLQVCYKLKRSIEKGINYNFFPDERENSRQHLHMTLREACAAKDVNLARKILIEAGPDAEMIVNLAPNGSNTLLFLYAFF